MAKRSNWKARKQKQSGNRAYGNFLYDSCHLDYPADLCHYSGKF